MCCLEFSKKIIPFAITFALGLFVAGIFNSFFATNKVADYRFESRTNSTNHHRRTECMYEKQMRTKDNFDDEDVIFLVPAPPMPPAPPIAPDFKDDADLKFEEQDEFDNTVFPPTPPETIILREEIRKSHR
jgi:hypothetical protein